MAYKLSKLFPLSFSRQMLLISKHKKNHRKLLKAMIAPNPISLLCVILLCLPLAVFFTATTAPTADKPPPSPPFPFPPPPTTTINKTHIYEKTLNNTHTSHVSTRSLNKTSTSQAHEQSLNKTKIHVQHHENITVWDDADESLSQLASRVNSDPPLGRPKKIAFLFLTTSPLPHAPLWELYFNKVPKYLYNIYVHADPTARYNSPFRGVFANRVISSKPTRRFSPTLSSGARRLLSHALLHDPSNYMFALVSPACIPLHSFNFTYKTLTKSRRSFIEILGNERDAFWRWAARGNTTMLPEVPLSDFRIGSQWFILTRQHARIIANDTKIWSKFKIPCKSSYTYTCYPEEQYFPTLMSMVDPHGCVPATLTHVDWSFSRGGHPRAYTWPEVGPELIWTIRNTTPRYGDGGMNGSDSSVSRKDHPFLFARKFPPGTIERLLDIANDVILKD